MTAEVETVPKAGVGPLSWVMDTADLKRMCAAIETATLTVMDLETTGLDEHSTRGGATNGGFPARVVLAAVTTPQEDENDPTTWVLPLSHPNSPWLGRWRAALRTVARRLAQRPLVNQNVKFDTRWVYAHTGVDLTPAIVWDTQISSHLLDENASTRLKERAPDTFGVLRWDDVDLTYPGAAEDADLFQLGEYAARDTYWTWKLAVAHRERMFLGSDDRPFSDDEIQEARLGKLARWCAMPMVASLGRMEQRGIRLDVDWTKEELAENVRERGRLLEELADRYGMDRDSASTAATSTWFKEWARRAVDAGDLRVAALTPNGAPQWSKTVLVRQARNGSEVAQMLLDQRGHTKRAEYLKSWLEHVTPQGTIHSTFHAGRVVTGRLSSDSPNLQQVTKALRPAFVPRQGYVIADLDYSQIELRVAAFVSRCEPMMQAYRDGRDLHRTIAAATAHKAEEDVTPEERQRGKAANFGLLYGMGAVGFREYAETAYGVSMTDEEAQRVHRTFFETWDGMAQWHSRQIARAHATGAVTSPIGRVRRLPQIWDANPKLVSHAERNSINSPIQGFASDLMQMAAASISGTLPGYSAVPGAHIVATVHDSIVVEVEEDRWEEIVRQCLDRMLTLHPVLERMDCHLDVPLAAEAVIGTRWGWDDVGTVE